MSTSTSRTSCPLCFDCFPLSVLERHASQCTGKITDDQSSNRNEKVPKIKNSFFTPSSEKKRKRSSAEDCDDDSSQKVAKVNQEEEEEEQADETETSNPTTTTTRNGTTTNHIPLAERMRPISLDQYLGQDLALAGVWKKLLEKNVMATSLIFWGPPGCGKTSLAHIIAQNSKTSGTTKFVKLSAVTSGVADVKKVVSQAKNDFQMFRRKTILFIDEVHRFNKSQQDAFLPHVENGTITLLGATTENPSFSLNKALLSRCKVIPLNKLEPKSISIILTNAAREDNIEVDEEAVEYLANCADGDARMALNCLQVANDSAGTRNISLDLIKESLKRSHFVYDRKGDEHYHCISALHKSIRGSDDNAALYWCMRMLQGGEDPMFIARRLVRIAGEDVGLADIQALPLAVSAMQGCQLIGKPECDVLLAECCVYLARAKKSHELINAIGKVNAILKSSEGNIPPVPLHLRNATSGLENQMGYGKGYSYDLKEVESIKYLPEEMATECFLTQ